MNSTLVTVYFLSMMLITAYILVNTLLGVLYNGFDKHNKI